MFLERSATVYCHTHKASCHSFSTHLNLSCFNFDHRFLSITLMLAPESINISTTTRTTVRFGNFGCFRFALQTKMVSSSACMASFSSCGAFRVSSKMSQFSTSVACSLDRLLPFVSLLVRDRIHILFAFHIFQL